MNKNSRTNHKIQAQLNQYIKTIQQVRCFNVHSNGSTRYKNQCDEHRWIESESEKLNDSNYSTPVPYSSFVNGLNNYYHTLLVSAEKYPCSNNSSDPITVIQVGSGSCQTVDINQFCNGKLRNTETYRVRFVLLDSTGLVAKTNWSAEISLMKDINFQGINKWPSGRSGGMITLTVILSVLLAILLVFLFAALAIGSRDICWKRTMDNEKRMSQMDFMTHSTYRSHHDHMYLVS
ncbi:uroplakin-3b-like [Leptodactylus fuscus]